MYYKTKTGTNGSACVWDEGSCVRRIGGFDIDTTNLPDTMEYLPKGAVMTVDGTSGKASLVKTATVHANAAKSATSIQIEKGSLFAVGDEIDGLEISAITTGTDYDTLTVEAITKDAGYAVGDVLDDGNGAAVAGLNYADVKLEGAPTCSITLQAYEIEEETLPYPINNTIKGALTDRHAFKI